MKTSISLAVLLLLFLCSMKEPKSTISSLKQLSKLMEKGYAYIPAGNTIKNGDTVSVNGFFMMKEEVSNFSYREYLSFLKNKGDMEAYKKALPDTMAWSSQNAPMKKYTEYYFNHPAYREYPCVNISREQAQGYCDFLTQIWRKNTKNESLVFRIPTQAEFLRAANGTDIKRPYAWSGPYLQNEKGLKCNFLNIGNGAITRDTETGTLKIVKDEMEQFYGTGEYMDVTAPVRSYNPNEFGIYNLNGNVSEMVSDGDFAAGGDWNSPGYDIRNESLKAFTKANPFVGFRPVMSFTDGQH